MRQLQIATGHWIPRKLPPPKIEQPRIPSACVGELVQIDGCEHHWFEDRAPACTALVYVDDATSRLMQILFTGTNRLLSNRYPNECAKESPVAALAHSRETSRVKTSLAASNLPGFALRSAVVDE